MERTMSRQCDREGDRRVVTFIAAGCFAVLIAIIMAMSLAKLPDWAESIFSAIAGGLVVKIADCLSALIALSSGRSVERLGDQLGHSIPPPRRDGDMAKLPEDGNTSPRPQFTDQGA